MKGSSESSKKILVDPLLWRTLLFCVVLCVALVDWRMSGLVRRTLSFYDLLTGAEWVDTRYVPRISEREEAVRQYVDEYLLGPSSIESGFLFVKGTRLESVLVRGKTAYVDLSALAALPSQGYPDVRRAVNTLRVGLLRNFSFLKEVRIFVNGHPVYANDGFSGQEGAVDGAKKVKSVDK